MLDLISRHFKTQQIYRYLYIFLPPESCYETEMIEVHHYGYEKVPENLELTKEFVYSRLGAWQTKARIMGTLKPFYDVDGFFSAISIKEQDVGWRPLDENSQCLFIPVHAGKSFTGLFYLRGEKSNTSFFDHPRTAHAICQMFHQRYCELWTRPESRKIVFSAREQEIINWAAQGKSNSVIGDIIGISKHTVDAYLRTIFAKLSVSNRTAAAVKAAELGLLSA